MQPGADTTNRRQQANWARRHPLLVVGLAPVLAVLVSVVFNAGYSVVYIEPLLSPRQHQLVQQIVLVFNLLAFPLAGAVWGWMVAALRRPLQQRAAGGSQGEAGLVQARARAINLPWHFSGIIALSNLAVALAVYLGVRQSGGAGAVFTMHLAIAVTTAALITITIAFFLIELLVQRLVFPQLFQDARPHATPGALPLSLSRRALLLAVTAAIGPIAMLLLIGWAQDIEQGRLHLFRIAVGLLGMTFACVGAWLYASLVLTPVRRLSHAARAVAAGDLGTRVELLRADEFGALVDEFNRMVGELREKQRLRETFGLHVGEAAAQQILAQNPGLGGREREITVLFCDIRNFTAGCTGLMPATVVAELNHFLTDMVEIVELRHAGMINKFLGDGFMALFGAGESDPDHARRAVTAAREMLVRRRRQQLAGNGGQLARDIGIGIHTGPAIVGNIGSIQRLEYTAIGDTVNLASRIEGLTKQLGVPLLLTEATRLHLPDDWPLTALGAQPVRGQPRPVAIFTLAGPD